MQIENLPNHVTEDGDNLAEHFIPVRILRKNRMSMDSEPADELFNHTFNEHAGGYHNAFNNVKSAWGNLLPQGNRSRRQSFLFDPNFPNNNEPMAAGFESKDWNNQHEHQYVGQIGHDDQMQNYHIDTYLLEREYASHLKDGNEYDEDAADAQGNNQRDNIVDASNKQGNDKEAAETKPKPKKKKAKKDPLKNGFALQFDQEPGSSVMKIVRKGQEGKGGNNQTPHSSKKKLNGNSSSHHDKAADSNKKLSSTTAGDDEEHQGAGGGGMTREAHEKAKTEKFLELLPEHLRSVFPAEVLNQTLVKYQEIAEKLKKNPNELFTTYSIPKELAEHSKTFANMLQAHQYSSRKVGTLTIEERRVKVEKYLQKRKQRTWCKKIAYDCRKRVADSRLRVKGRFVTKDQAISILGIDEEIFNRIGLPELRSLLAAKYAGTTPGTTTSTTTTANPSPASPVPAEKVAGPNGPTPPVTSTGHSTASSAVTTVTQTSEKPKKSVQKSEKKQQSKEKDKTDKDKDKETSADGGKSEKKKIKNKRKKQQLEGVADHQ